MGLKTTPQKSTRQKIVDLREKHQPIFDDVIGDPQALFFPKMAYLYRDGQKVISFFPSEIGRGQDIYTEFVSRDYTSEDPERRLWRWNYNPDYETAYPTTDPHPVTGDVRYEISIDELELIGEEEVAEEEAAPEPEESKAPIDFEAILPNANEDLPLSEMTICDYAAIHLNKPVSKKGWLNEIINQNK